MIPMKDLLHVELQNKAMRCNSSVKNWLAIKKEQVSIHIHAQKNSSVHHNALEVAVETLKNSRLLSAEETAAWPTKENQFVDFNKTEFSGHDSRGNALHSANIIKSDIKNPDILLGGYGIA